MERKKVMVDLQQLDLLEQRIVKATEVIRAARRERDAAQARIQELEQALGAARKDAAATEQRRQEFQEASEQLEILKEERQAIRGRVNRMLEMMAGLDDGAAESQRDH